MFVGAPSTSLGRLLDQFAWRQARWGWPAFLLVAASAYIVAGASDWLRLLAQLWLAYCAAWLLLHATHRLGGAAASVPRLISALAAATLLAALVAALLGVAGVGQPAYAGSGWRDLLMQWPASAAAAAVCATVLSLQASAEWRLQRQRAQAAERERLITLERELLGSQLKLLQAQIEPHFLYNSLANVQQLVRQDAVAADRMLAHLIDYLRAAVPAMRAGVATLGSELALARAYLEVMKFRMGPRLDFSVSAPDDLLGVALPPTVIGTLIENAIKHGLERSAAGGRIDVSVRRDAGLMVVDVADTGLGINTFGGGSGVGLSNARERLVLLHGALAELDLMPNQPCGIVARMKIPLPA